MWYIVDHSDGPFVAVHDPVMASTQEQQVVQICTTAVFPVGVDMGRGSRISPGPFPHVAPPNRTCASQRIRLSTSYAVVTVVGFSHGVGILVPR